MHQDSTVVAFHFRGSSFAVDGAEPAPTGRARFSVVMRDYNADADWPDDETVSRAFGLRVSFFNAGPRVGEAIYEEGGAR